MNVGAAAGIILSTVLFIEIAVIMVRFDLSAWGYAAMAVNFLTAMAILFAALRMMNRPAHDEVVDDKPVVRAKSQAEELPETAYKDVRQLQAIAGHIQERIKKDGPLSDERIKGMVAVESSLVDAAIAQLRAQGKIYFDEASKEFEIL